MFTEIEIANIQARKLEITRHFEDMINQPWFDNGLAINWRSFYLSGGAIASLFHGEKPKDWDLYTSDPLAMKMVNEMVIRNMDHVADVKENYVGVFGIDGKMITANAITMKDGTSFITKSYLPADEMKKTFDYVHCTPHFDIVDRKLYISRRQYDAIVNKKLEINNAMQCLAAPWRKEKFLKRGYTE